MSTTKVPPPRKLTEKEDLDSFEDFWFQIETYYGRDALFAVFMDDPSLRWRGKDVTNRGLRDVATATNLNTFLRALATYALGPYIKKNILENCRSLSEVKREFMKLLEIDLSDTTFMNFYEVKRRVNERPLMFYHRIRYHAERHLLRAGDRVGGVTLDEDEKLSPTLERLIILEWLRRIDDKYISEVCAGEICHRAELWQLCSLGLSGNLGQEHGHLHQWAEQGRLCPDCHLSCRTAGDRGRAAPAV